MPLNTPPREAASSSYIARKSDVQLFDAKAENFLFNQVDVLGAIDVPPCTMLLPLPMPNAPLAAGMAAAAGPRIACRTHSLPDRALPKYDRWGKVEIAKLTS